MTTHLNRLEDEAEAVGRTLARGSLPPDAGSIAKLRSVVSDAHATGYALARDDALPTCGDPECEDAAHRWPNRQEALAAMVAAERESLASEALAALGLESDDLEESWPPMGST